MRDAAERDAVALARLWRELLPCPGAEHLGRPPELAVADAVLRYSADDQGRIIVAVLDGAVVGCGFLSLGLASPLDEGRVVHLSHVQVADGCGRQGVGSALVEEALTWAEHHGVGSVVASVPANHREGNRFLARLGMAPVASLRGAPVAVLRGRLPHVPSAVARQNGRLGRSVDKVVAARRSQRLARSRQVAP